MLKDMEDVLALQEFAEAHGGLKRNGEMCFDAESLNGLLEAARKLEREACKKACADVREGGNGTPKNYEDTHADGFTDGCNECEWAIHARSNARNHRPPEGGQVD